MALTWVPGVERRDSPNFGPHYCLYHFEWERHDGEQSRGLMPRSTAFWIGVAHRLNAFFGGSVQFQDCSNRSDLSTPETPWIGATDGAAWDELQVKLSEVQPLTHEELRAFQPFAAYAVA